MIGSLEASLRTSKETLLRTPTSKKLRHWIERPNNEARNLKTNLLPNSPRRVRTNHSTASASRLLPTTHPTKGTGVVKNVLSPNTGEARRQNMPMFRDDCVHHHLEYCLSQDPPQNGHGLTKLFLLECQPNRSAKTFHFTNGEAVAPPFFKLLVINFSTSSLRAIFTQTRAHPQCLRVSIFPKIDARVWSSFIRAEKHTRMLCSSHWSLGYQCLTYQASKIFPPHPPPLPPPPLSQCLYSLTSQAPACVHRVTWQVLFGRSPATRVRAVPPAETSGLSTSISMLHVPPHHGTHVGFPGPEDVGMYLDVSVDH